MEGHRAAGRISIQTLAGHVRLRTGGTIVDLPVGRLVSLGRDVPHDVEAVAESAFLLTIAWQGIHGDTVEHGGIESRKMSATIEEHLEVVAARSGAEVTAAVLAKQSAGIAVMASHGRGGVLRWELGSTAEEVLDQSPCPILIVRAGTTATEPADISAPVARDARSP